MDWGHTPLFSFNKGGALVVILVQYRYDLQCKKNQIWRNPAYIHSLITFSLIQCTNFLKILRGSSNFCMTQHFRTLGSLHFSEFLSFSLHFYAFLCYSLYFTFYENCTEHIFSFVRISGVGPGLKNCSAATFCKKQ